MVDYLSPLVNNGLTKLLVVVEENDIKTCLKESLLKRDEHPLLLFPWLHKLAPELSMLAAATQSFLHRSFSMGDST